MTLRQILLTVAVTFLTTIVALAVTGCVLLYIIAGKVRDHALGVRNRHGTADPLASQTALAQVQKIAWLMDSSIPIAPGIRIGIDGLLDLVPGIGDLAGVVVSAWIVYRAAACGAPQPVLMRMAANIAIDALLGAFPILGFFADSAFKANIRNVAILREYLERQEHRSAPPVAIDIS